MVTELIRKKIRVPKATRLAREKETKELEEDLKSCLANMIKNEALFNLETDESLLEARIYERQALQCHYRYLLEKARAIGLRVRGIY